MLYRVKEGKGISSRQEEQFNPVPVHKSEEKESIIGERRISYALPPKKEKPRFSRSVSHSCLLG